MGIRFAMDLWNLALHFIKLDLFANLSISLGVISD